MLIYLGAFAVSVGIAAYGEHLRTKKNNEKGFYLCLALAVLVMAVLAGLRDPSIGTDSVVYEGWVADAKLQDGLLACIRQRHKTEPLFMTLVYLAAHVFGDVHWLYFMVDLLACGLFMIGLVQYKEYVSVPYGWLAYLCLYYGDTYNAERQSVALGVAFLAFSFVWKKKYHWAVLLLAVLPVPQCHLYLVWCAADLYPASAFRQLVGQGWPGGIFGLPCLLQQDCGQAGPECGLH